MKEVIETLEKKYYQIYELRAEAGRIADKTLLSKDFQKYNEYDNALGKVREAINTVKTVFEMTKHLN